MANKVCSSSECSTSSLEDEPNLIELYEDLLNKYACAKKDNKKKIKKLAILNKKCDHAYVSNLSFISNLKLKIECMTKEHKFVVDDLNSKLKFSLNNKSLCNMNFNSKFFELKKKMHDLEVIHANLIRSSCMYFKKNVNIFELHKFTSSYASKNKNILKKIWVPKGALPKVSFVENAKQVCVRKPFG
jgi:hypothetical protein